MIVKNKGSWCEKHNQYARTKFDCHYCELDELRERVAWLLECEDYLLFLNPTNRWRSMFAYPELRHIVNAARKAVEELL